VSEFKGSLVFLHEVVRGAADRSYGIQVARLAGLPASAVKRARKVLADLEAARPSGTLDSLPLFSYEPHEPAGPARDALRDAVAALDPDAMSPREAHAALYELKRLIDEKG
jgi:DNA mismatch repair protein MutS